MIPSDLRDWNYETIKKLIEANFFETDRFDFKEDIPSDIEKTVCAFANTEGGFLIFGVKDDRDLSLEERIVGIDYKRDFPREFGDKIRDKIDPPVYFEFKNPPIKIPNSKNVIHVIKIPQSPERPHMVVQNKLFYYRTNKGNDIMTRNQVKNSFLDWELRRQKLRLLFIELLSNKEVAEAMIVPEDKIKGYYSLVTFDSTILQTLLVDTYPIIMRDSELIRLLITIREEIKVINNKMRIFFVKVALPLSGMQELVKKHNEFINKKVENLLPLIDKALKILQDRYGILNPYQINDDYAHYGV